MTRPDRSTGLRRALPAVAIVLLAACGKTAAPPAAPAVPEVTAITVAARSAPLSVDLVGDIRAFREVDLRPRVTGLVEKQLFQPGQAVKTGEALFEIDSRQYDSAVLDAAARVAEAEAALAKARQDVERYRPLLPDNAIPRQTFDQAVATEAQSASVVQSRKSALERSKLDRGYAVVRSPVTGRVGLQKIEVGGLATAGQTVLATVSTLDHVVVYFSVSEPEYLDYTRRVQAAKKAGRIMAPTQVGLVLADGSPYGLPGKIDFSDRQINPSTGTLTLRAVFSNPDDLLRPGMNARVLVTYDTVENAILVPQKAVSEMLGKRFVTVIGSGNKVEQRPVKTGARMGDQWMIENGLTAGERIVVDGLQKARPGAVVKPVAPAATASPAPTAARQ